MTAIQTPVIMTQSVTVMGIGRHTITHRPPNDEIRNQLIDLTKTGKTQILTVMIERGNSHRFQIIDLDFGRTGDGLTFAGMMANGSALVKVHGFLPNGTTDGWITLTI